jgi:microcin C transport system permease protein
MMRRYIVQRLILMIPTLFLILLLNFAIIQCAPGGPIDQLLHQLDMQRSSQNSAWGYAGQQGLTPELIEQLKIQYGFDQPFYQRFLNMLQQYAQLDLGESYFKEQSVLSLIAARFPVSLSLGLWSTLCIYLISIPLGIQKAKRQGSRFDRFTTMLLAFAYAMPAFILALLLIILFAGGSYWQWFPLQGLHTDGIRQQGVWSQLKDYVWHLCLPVLALSVSGCAALTYLTQYSFSEQLQRQYVTVARAKGLSEFYILYKHVFRNASLTLVAGLPEVLLAILFSGNVLIEILFNIDGLGLLAYESIVQRDYPVIFGLLFVLTLSGMLLRLFGDLLYHWVDPRINFTAQGHQ